MKWLSLRCPEPALHVLKGATLFSACLLGACVTSNPAEQWLLSGLSPAQFEADRASCKSIAAGSIDNERVRTAGGGMARGGGMAALGGLLAAAEWAQSQGVLDRCMESRGYMQRK